MNCHNFLVFECFTLTPHIIYLKKDWVRVNSLSGQIILAGCNDNCYTIEMIIE